MALPEGHLFRAVADRSYRPKNAPNGDQWELAYPLLIEILSADPRRLTDGHLLLGSRRAVLARHLYWLAGEYPDQLNADFALDERQVVRSAACDPGRTNDRSRIAFMSQVRSFRPGYPKLFAGKRQVPEIKHLEPVTDREFAVALAAAETFRTPATRDHVRALLFLCRGAGADGADCRYVVGTDVYRLPAAGLWVRLRRPGHSREVPVLERFAFDLEELAQRAGSRLLVSRSSPPGKEWLCNELTDMLKRRLQGRYPGLLVSPTRLRKAWLLEQIVTWEKLHVFLQAAGLTSMHSVEFLQAKCPEPTTDPVRLAELLGGLSSRGDG